MLDEKTTETTDAERVEESARRLWERLNPTVRDREISRDAPVLPIYDWEIASDLSVDLDVVRSALESLDGGPVALETVNHERFVIGLTQEPIQNVA